MPTLDKIAPELQHMVFAEILWHDSGTRGNLRLTCKTLADVGLQYVFFRLRFSFNSDSINRLVEISQHPAGHCVKRLTYDVSPLKERNVEWFLSPDPDHDFDDLGGLPRPHENASDREWRAWRRSYVVANGVEISKRQAKKEWKERQIRFLDQQRLQGIENDDVQFKITAVLQRLTMLKDLAFTSADPDDRAEEVSPPYGLPQIRSFLRAIESVGTKLESLEFRRINWRLFEGDDEAHQTMKKIVAPLQSVKFSLRTFTETDLDYYTSLLHRMQLFKQGRPLDLFQSMPQLQVLEIRIDACEDEWDRVDLDQVVKGTRWSQLGTVTLSGFQTTTKTLVRFLQGHAQSLRFVNLNNINLLRGSWSDIFICMRESLDLKDFCYYSLFQGPDLTDGWLADHEGVRNYVLKRNNASFEDVIKACCRFP